MKKLLIYLRDYKKESILAPAFKMLEATFDLLVPLVMAAIINTGIANKDKGYILSRCGLLILLGVIGLTCSITAQYFAAKASVGFCTKVRHVLFSHIQSLGFAEMDKLGTSTLITRMTSDINQVQSGLNLFLRLFLRSPFIVFGSIVMAFIVSPKAAVIFVVTIPLLSIVVFGIMLITMPLYRKVQGSLDGILGITRENLTGVRVIRAFGREEQEKDRFEENNGLLVRSQLLVGKISALMNPLTYVMINLAVVVILNTGAVQIHLGNMQQGDVVALVNYMNQILVSLLRLADLVISVTRALASGMRVNEILNTHTTMPDPAAAELGAEPVAPAVAFDDVTFTYNGAGAPSLTNVSFTAKPGETIGVIGGTGSGKSTLIDLVCRFYDATTGTVSLFGHNVKEYGFTQLRRMVGIVPQQAVLFTGTIRDNMRWAAPDATDEEIWQALEIAQAADFVHTKPGMLDAPVETAGRNFSGGQRQRLTIARALVPKPKVLILDDSASALDFATDAALRKAIKEKTEGMTVFIVSQRAASVQRADHILVLDDGVLTGDATHSQLLKTCEVYKEICLSQLSKEEVEKTL